jgi:chromosome partitioning protein
MAIFPFINLKGGVAKTTNAIAVAEAFASRGRRVLVVDADHQCTASEILLGESRMLAAERDRRTLHDLLCEMFDVDFSVDQFAGFVHDHASNVREAQSNLCVLPSSVRLDELQTNFAKARRGYATVDEFDATLRRHDRMFQRWIQSHFDHVLIDCPPSLTTPVRFALRVCDGYIVPSIPDHLSVRGVLHLQARLAKRGTKCPALGTLWTLFRAQVERHRSIVGLVKKRTGRLGSVPAAFEAVIPNAAAIAHAVENEETHANFVSKYTRPFASLYLNLCQEIEARLRRLGHPLPGQLFA